MTLEHEQNLAEANELFLKLSDAKYRAGQAEHGGKLWELPGLLDEAMKEVIDQWHYLFNLKKQIETTINKFNDYAHTQADQNRGDLVQGQDS